MKVIVHEMLDEAIEITVTTDTLYHRAPYPTTKKAQSID